MRRPMPRRMFRQSSLRTWVIGFLTISPRALTFFEHRRLGHLGADDHADDDQQDGQQERHPPGPGAGQVDADQEDQVGQQQADREAGLDDAGVLALLLPGRVFVGHQDRAAPFGAVGQALDDRGR